MNAIKPYQVDHEKQLKIGFLLLPGYSFLSFCSLMETFHAANHVVENDCFNMTLYTLSQKSVKASNGMKMTTEILEEVSSPLDMLFVLGKDQATQYKRLRAAKELAEITRKTDVIISVDGAVQQSMRVGLLEGYEISLDDKRYDKDRDRYVVAGSNACLDLALKICQEKLGLSVATETSEMLCHIPARPLYA